LNQVKNAVITAGGLGSRMKVVNPHLPKELLPIYNRPAIDYALEEIVSAQISRAIIILNPEKDIIRKYYTNLDFANKLYPKAVEIVKEITRNLSIEFLFQTEPTGEMGAVYQARELVEGEAFAIIYPDDLHLPSGKVLESICSVFYSHLKNVIALSMVDSVNFPYIGNTGKVNLESKTDNLFTIRKFLPKTKGHFILRYPREFRTCGYMISRPEIFDYIDKVRMQIKKEINDLHVRNEMIKHFEFLAYFPSTQFYDIGNPAGYYHFINKHQMEETKDEEQRGMGSH
jgi:UTP--glucose-1-phosphate uridylyltransferase